jgi:tRNA(Ile)-lysidine synthase
MAALGPFEPAPTLALAVSGGPDSTALALLAARWAVSRNGAVVALTVDHRLREESQAEARRVGRWLAARGIGQRILVWRGPHPESAVQEAARRARYALLTGYCRRRGILHLLLAHHLEDQVETVAMRRAVGSGPDGLAGMAALSERDGVRLLRPLLGVPPATLRDYLAAAGQDFVEDPSNRDPRFLRPRLRRTLRAAERESALALARREGVRRARREARTARLLAAALSLDPAGYALIDPVVLRRADDEAIARLLGAAIATVGGGAYQPAPAALARLAAHCRSGRFGAGRTLGGCRILAWRERLLICREARAAAPPLSLGRLGTARWDGRFDLVADGAPPPLTLTMLGAGGIATLRREREAAEALARRPAPVRPTLCALVRLDASLTVPHLDYQALRPVRSGDGATWRIAFRPARRLAEAPFVAQASGGRVVRRGPLGV